MDEQLKSKKMIDLEKKIKKLSDERHLLYKCFNILNKIKEFCRHSIIWRNIIGKDIQEDISVCIIELQDKIKDVEFEYRKAQVLLDEYNKRINNRRNHIQTEHLGDMALRSDVEKTFGRGK